MMKACSKLIYTFQLKINDLSQFQHIYIYITTQKFDNFNMKPRTRRYYFIDCALSLYIRITFLQLQDSQSKIIF